MVKENKFMLSLKESMDAKLIHMLFAFIHFLFVLMEATFNLQSLRVAGGSQKQKYIIYAVTDD